MAAATASPTSRGRRKAKAPVGWSVIRSSLERNLAFEEKKAWETLLVCWDNGMNPPVRHVAGIIVVWQVLRPVVIYKCSYD